MDQWVKGNVVCRVYRAVLRNPDPGFYMNLGRDPDPGFYDCFNLKKYTKN
jgi:hypothetical protein